ncbi:HTTM domain-containing protein [Microbacterium sp. JZ37]|uniref:HTTM domain-containing protein n=1 Tax=Microbacterium sp. JZ37 TaxID=2654193 RepID=UPI002B472B5B|nr:HTTM domain-containing protein [Microbacterium sp. JZ37]WRH18569.1 HTTM domain-containing protein [Microbacterium sp. JZ37]
MSAREKAGIADRLGEVRAIAARTPRALGRLVSELLRIVWDVARRAWLFTEAWLLDSKKSLYGIAVTRILLGLTGVGLLLTNFSTRLYTFGSGSAWNGEAAEPVSDFPKIWLFGLFDSVRLDDGLFTVLYLVLLALAVLFTLGWRFKIVLPVYFVLWVSFIEMNDAVGDQGDNMYRIVLILLFFADPAARWSLDARRRARGGDRTILPREISNLLHNLALVAMTAQVCFVYVSGGLYKAGGDPWSGGYAVYNPLMTERFGTWPVLSELITAWGPAVTIASWGSIILQIAFPFMLLSRPTRILALFGIMSFHIGIGVLMGLPWFSLAMIGIDFIFIRDRTWQRALEIVKGSFRSDDDAMREAAAETEPASEADPVVSDDRAERGRPVGAGGGVRARRR